MLDNNQIQEFKKNFKLLYQAAIDHLIQKEWVEHIDRDVRITVPLIDENKIEFELIHTMVNKILASKSMTWEEVNQLLKTE
jgi:Ca2+-binding EF-hand superfamily protein